MRPSATLRGLVAGMALVYLGLLVGLGVGFADDLPVLGWIGLGLVAVVVATVALGTIVVFERIDGAAGARAVDVRPAADGRRRLLVVADVGCEGTDVCPAIIGHVHRGVPTEVFVVAPTIVSAFRHLMDDEDRERETAGRRLDEIVRRLRDAGVPAYGMVGSDLPLEAIQDALAVFPADEILVLAPPTELAAWSEVGLVDRARSASGLPVSHVPVLRTTPEPMPRSKVGEVR